MLFPTQELHVRRPREATNLKMPFALVDVHSTRGRGIENGFREAGVGESLNSLHRTHRDLFSQKIIRNQRFVLSR